MLMVKPKDKIFCKYIVYFVNNNTLRNYTTLLTWAFFTQYTLDCSLYRKFE